MLKANVLDGLNKQINQELYSSYVYLSMSAWFETRNLRGFAHWMRIQAQEELTHVMKLYTYIVDKNGRVELAAVQAPKIEWESPLKAVKEAYKHECDVSESINRLVTLAMKEEDHSTRVFLQWFVAEQVEEESNADSLVQKLKLIEGFPPGLFMIDNELAGRTFAPAPEA